MGRIWVLQFFVLAHALFSPIILPTMRMSQTHHDIKFCRVGNVEAALTIKFAFIVH